MLFMIWTNQTNAQVKEPKFHDSLFSTYYHQRVSIFNSIPISKNEIIFLGNSITDSGEWPSYFGDKKIINFGISGDVTAGILHRLPHIIKRKPSKIFLMIGTNDLARGIDKDTVLNNLIWIADYIHQKSHYTQLFIQSILPVNEVYGKFPGHTKNNDKIKVINENVSAIIISPNNSSSCVTVLKLAK